MALGRTGQDALSVILDARVEALEKQVSAGAAALLATQLQLAELAAMLPVLDNELRKKMSTSDVDRLYKK